jgi:teichuronic acid biosynthesis glycosyltransferase TuaG
MINNYLVSVIMPAYNAELYISEAIQSVIDQSINDWELIIIDNCSTDETVKIVKSFQFRHSNIKLYSTVFNSGGPAVPRNIGINNSTGKYLAFIDSDDVWVENKLYIQLPYLKKYTLVCSLTDKIDYKGHIIKSHECAQNKELNACSVIYKNSIINSSVIVNRNLFLSTLFDEDELIIGLEDYSSYIRYLTLHGNALLIGKPLLKYRVSRLSLGSAIVGERRLAMSIYCLMKSILMTDDYRCLIGGLIVRLRSYFKYRLVSFFSRRNL